MATKDTASHVSLAIHLTVHRLSTVLRFNQRSLGSTPLLTACATDHVTIEHGVDQLQIMRIIIMLLFQGGK